MRKVSMVALLLLLCGVYAFAGNPFPSSSSDSPKAELFAGYSYLHLDCGGCSDAGVPAGFNVDGTYYFSGALGLTADFQYHHKDFGGGDTGRVVSFHGGPRFKARSGKIEPFAHALFGFTHLSETSAGITDSDNAFSMKLGGGIDVGVARHFALRLGEFNYYFTKFDATPTSTSPFAGGLNGQTHQNNFTFSTGIVIR